MNYILGVLGLGAIGKRHCAVADANSEIELKCGIDIDPYKRKEIAELYGIPTYTTVEEALSFTNINILSIATPHGLHAEQAIKSMQLGVSVIVEKPMALTIADCELMNSVAEKTGQVCIVVKQNRFNKPVRRVKGLIESNALGKIYLAQCNIFWNRGEHYYQDSTWRGKIELEGGALFTQASHFIDLLNWWLGPLSTAKTELRRFKQKVEIEDTGVSALSFDSGAIASISWTTCVYNKNFEGSITLIGEKGTVKIGGPYLNRFDYWDVLNTPEPDPQTMTDLPNDYGKYKGTSSNHDKLYEAIAHSFIQDRYGIVEGKEGLVSISTIEKIYQDYLLTKLPKQ